jgi:hypothetical protein
MENIWQLFLTRTENLNYSQIYQKELNISENFKNMLKDYFGYNLNDILKHKDISLKFEKQLTINEAIIDIIVNGIKNEYSSYARLNKAKALIKFYPNIPDENNKIKKFGECFQILSGENYNMEQIETNYPTLWEKCLPILTECILKKLHEDKNIINLCKRVNIPEDDIFIILNNFYSIIEKKKYEYNFIPNENNEFISKLYITDDIDNDLKEALRLLNKDEDYSDFLLNSKVNRANWDFPKKFIKDIATQIDKNIKKQFKLYKTDKNNKEFNCENFKKTCGIIVKQWFPKNYDIKNI